MRRERTVEVRTAELDLDVFRGPCDPAGGDLGPVTGRDAVLARAVYRFAADPSLGAPFAPGDTWTGIEDGLASRTVSGGERGQLDAWRLDTSYAERSGPFSALDTLARSGGWYQLRRGVAATCPTGRDGAPPQLAGLRALTLTAPADTVSSCLDWWAVTLFLDSQDRVRGVALRLGSP